MTLTTGKIAEVMFESYKETFEQSPQMLDLCTFNEPDAGMMQNAGNVIWRPKQQHAPIISGWDLTDEETDIIEETYPAILGTPSNDFVKQRADDMRDMIFWKRRAVESGKRQAFELNKQIAAAIATQGSLYIRTDATSGFDVLGEAQVAMNERQLRNMGRAFVFNDRDNYKFAKDLAGRQTLQGRPESVWGAGMIAQNVAEFDVYTGSFLPNLSGGADPATTVTGDQSFAPEAGSVNTSTGVVTNVDCRIATIAVADSSSYNVGDKVEIRNAGVAVNAIGLADKTDSNQPMTFTIVAKPSGTSISVYPKPIAADDSALSTTELAYANIDTVILNGATVNRLNTDTSVKTNLFFDKSAVEVLGGVIPANLLADFDGKKVINDTMSNGLNMYMVYDGSIVDMSFRYRLFTWWGITVCCPENAGVVTTF